MSRNLRSRSKKIEQPQCQMENRNENSNINCDHTNRSKGTVSVSSSVNIIRQLEMEIETNKKIALLEEKEAENRLQFEAEEQKRKIEREKELIFKQLELNKIRLEGSLCEESITEDSHDKQVLSPENQDIQNWIDKIPSSLTDEKVSEYLVKSRSEFQKEKQVTGADETTRQIVNLERYIKRQSIDKALPVFSGNPTEWLLFITEYKETTEICGFSHLENIVRLRKCLKGEARENVKMLLLSHSNVPEILETLQKLYGRPEYVIKNLIQDIKQTQQSREDKPETLVNFGTVLKNLVTAVKHLDGESYITSPQLLDEIVNLLPSLLKQKWAEYIVRFMIERPNLQDLVKWFKEISEAASMLYTPKISIYEEQRRGYKRYDSVLTTTKALECHFCKKSHQLQDCGEFQKEDIENRWKLLQENGLCYACLKGGHSIAKCRNKRCCGRDGCKKTHHRLLHVITVKGEKVKEQRVYSKSVYCQFNRREIGW